MATTKAFELGDLGTELVVNADGTVSSLNVDTDAVSEGSTNLYYTNTRARGAISVSGNLTYNSSTGVLGFTMPTTIASLSNHDTDDLTEGTSNLYFTSARARASLSGGTGITYSSSTGQVELTASGVTAGTYGNASNVSQITVDTYGRITSVSNVAVAGVDNVTYNTSTGVLGIETSSGTDYSVDLGIGTGDSPTFQTLNLTADLDMGDNDHILLGIGDDLDIYHDASHSYIVNDTGQLYITNNSGNIEVSVPHNTGNAIKFNFGSNDNTTQRQVMFYKDAFEPASAYTGLIDLGGTSTNWRNLYLSGNITVGGTVDGRDIATDGTKLDGIESGATADQTASEILTLIKTVDGAGSGLDADLLDGINSSSFLRSDADDTYGAATNTLTIAGVVRSINNGNVYGSNFDVNTTNKDTTLYAYSVSRSGSIVGGITIGGKGVFDTGLIVDTNTLVVDSSTNKVGIGTTSPQSKLDVDGVISNRLNNNGFYSTGILDITSSAASSQVKITTNIPYSGVTHAFTVKISGFYYESAQTVDLTISWHVYNNSFYNRTASSSGSFAPNITLAVENGYVVIHLGTLGYWPKLFVESVYGTYGNPSMAEGWSWSNAAISADANTPNQSVPYKSNFGNSFVMDSSGNVGIGTTSPAYKLDVNGSARLSNGGNLSGTFSGSPQFSGQPYFSAVGPTGGFKIHSNGGITASGNYMQFYTTQVNGWRFNNNSDGSDSTNVNKFVISTSGNVTAAGEITANSDERLKSDIQTITNAVDTVKALRGCAYIKDDKASIGVIAQEIEEVLPQVVFTADDEMGTKSVAYGNIVAVLIEAIKEQQEQIDELKKLLEAK